MLDDTIGHEEIHIEGFCRDVFGSDHPSNTKTGSVCLYFHDGLAQDLNILQ